MRRLVILLPACAACGIDGASMSVYDDGAHALIEMHEALEASSGLLEVDVAKSAADNATAIQQRALKSLNGCGSVELSGSTDTNALPPAGCGLGEVNVNGTLSADVVVGSGTVTVTETFTGVRFMNPMVAQKTLSGTLKFATQNNTRFTVDVSLQDDGTDALAGSALSANLTVNGNSMDGMANLTLAGATTAALLTDVVWSDGDCTPRDGTMGLTRAGTADTMTFGMMTLQSGEVQIVWAHGSTTQLFPANGHCAYG
jgi:hypothetical protein